MDVHITYETLFDLLRKERSLEELQTLDQQFWKYVINYMKEREEVQNTSRPGEQEKAKIQLQNIKRILKEIYERRERKILNLALNVIRTDAAGYVDTNNMLAEEKALFEETLSLLRRYKEGVLKNVFENQLPTIVSEDHYAKQEEENSASNESERRDSESKADSEAETVGVATNERSEAKQSSDENVKNHSKGTGEDGVIVKFTTSVPKFYGKNKEIFGPYEKEQIVTLPDSIAQILLKKGKVEKVMNS
ncbi:MAG: hypothetical protein ACLFTH_04595 [Candidatus Woesearchaeota archaeon]